MLAGLFKRCIQRRGIRPSDPYDWEKQNIIHESLATMKSLPTVTAPPVFTNTTTANQTLATQNVDPNNQENVEPDNKKELDVSKMYIYLNNNIQTLS